MKNSTAILHIVSLLLAMIGMAGSAQAQDITITAAHCVQTTGCGNLTTPMQLLTINNNGNKDMVITDIDIVTTKTTLRNTNVIGFYTTPTAEYFAERRPVMVGSTRSKMAKNRFVPAATPLSGDEVMSTIRMQREGLRIKKGTTYLWLTTDVKKKATPGNRIRASVIRLLAHTDKGDTILTPTAARQQNDDAGVLICQTESFPYVPTTDVCRYYRIPAMTLNSNGDILLHTGLMSRSRTGLRLWMSLDERSSWHSATTIQQGNAAYSTIERLPNGDVAILYEDGAYHAGNRYHIDHITLTKEQILSYYCTLKKQQNKLDQ